MRQGETGVAPVVLINNSHMDLKDADDLITAWKCDAEFFRKQ